MDIAFVLGFMRPGEEWKLSGDDYESLEWLSDTQKPTLKEIENAEPAAIAAREEKIAAAQAKKQALLERLGITEEEASLLLA